MTLIYLHSLRHQRLWHVRIFLSIYHNLPKLVSLCVYRIDHPTRTTHKNIYIKYCIVYGDLLSTPSQQKLFRGPVSVGALGEKKCFQRVDKQEGDPRQNIRSNCEGGYSKRMDPQQQMRDVGPQQSLTEGQKGQVDQQSGEDKGRYVKCLKKYVNISSQQKTGEFQVLLTQSINL